MTAEVEGIGSGTIKYGADPGKVVEISLQDVLHVPTLGCNLLSVKKLTKDGYKVNFEEQQCQILKNGELQATARMFSELYELKTVEKTSAVNEAINTGHADNCQHSWHRRFGHRHPVAVKELAEKGLATGIRIKDCGTRETCECCIKGKMTRIPFPKEATNRTRLILDLIHTDVCGPMQTMTPGNKRYILTIIDDFSRYTKGFLMSYKSEAEPFIKEFVETVKTEFNKKPKVIRSD